MPKSARWGCVWPSGVAVLYETVWLEPVQTESSSFV